MRAYSVEQYAAALPGLQVQSFKIALWRMGLFYLTAVFFGMFL